MAYYDAFITKWGTVSGTAAQKLVAVNAATASGPAAAMVVPTYRIYNLIVASEFAALTAANQQIVRDILNMGTVDASPGTQIRARIVALFPNGTTTFANLTALAATFDSPTVPWWQANGYARPFDTGDVAAAGLS